MAGHSKWANIQHRKGRQDEKRGKVWTRVIREIMVAARTGGGDLGINPRLRLAVEKAKAAPFPDASDLYTDVYAEPLSEMSSKMRSQFFPGAGNLL